MDFQVRKGLETPLKVHGMRTKFFCIYCIILAVIVRKHSINSPFHSKNVILLL